MQDFDTNTIGKRSVHGVIALISRSFFLNIVSYIASLVIFTYLSPKEFGIYVVVIAIQRVISFFTDFGFGAALIQKKEQLREEDIKTSFTIQTILTLLVFIVVLLLRDVIAVNFSLNETSIRLLMVLVFSIFLSSFKMIPSTLLARDIKFHKLVFPQIFESLIFNILLIVLIFNNQGLDSYTWAFLISELFGIPVYYYVSPWKIEFGINKASLVHLKYGLQFQAKNILATIKDDFLTVFLAKTLSFVELGYVGFGQRNAFFAYRFVVDNVTKVTFSTYSRMQDNMEFLRNAIEKSLFYISFVMFPLIFGIIIFSPYFVEHFPRWHGKWEAALMSLTFFSLNALISSISGILVNVLDACGKVKTTLKLMILWTILTWLLTALLVYYMGYNGVAVASFLVTLTIFYTVRLVKSVIEFNILSNIYKPFTSSVIMVLFGYFLCRVFVSDIISLIAIVFVSGLVYLGCIYLFAKKELHQGLRLAVARS